MPFKSDSQRRWMYANHPAMAKRWQKETPKGDLPEKVSSYDDTAFSEDPTKMMPRLRQIHKLSEFPTGSGPEDMDAMKQSPGKIKSSQGFEYAETGTNAGGSGYDGPKLWSPGKIKRAAGMMPSMSEQFYMRGMGGAGGGEEVMPLELVSMAGPQAAQGAQMAQMANRLAERPSQRFAQRAAEQEAARDRVVQGLAKDLERLKMEEAGLIKKPGLLDRIMNKQGSFIPGVPDRAGMATSKSALSALADRTGVPLQQVKDGVLDGVLDVKDGVRGVVGSLVPKMEKKGELSPDEKARITKDSMRAHIAPRMLAGSLGGAALGSLVGAVTGKGVGVPSLVGTLAGAGLGAVRGAHLGKKQAPERWKAYEHKANKLIDPASLSRIAKKRGVTDAQARDSLVLGRVRRHSHYPHEGTPGDRMKFMDDWVAADAPTLQKQAYKLQGQTEVQGIPIAIENKPGSVRKGTDSDGNEWRTKMKVPYGYIKGTKGADGDEVDAFVGPDKEAPNAFVVHQHKPDGTGYDEDKVILGTGSKAEAKRLYLAHYDDPKFLGSIARVSTERLKELVASKKKLVKISQVSYRAMLDEIMFGPEMQKEAFGPEEARKVLRLAKSKVLKVPRTRQAYKRIVNMKPGDPMPISVAEGAVLQSFGAPSAMSRGTSKVLEKSQKAGAFTPKTPGHIAQIRQLEGKITTAKGGDATSAIRRSALGPAVKGPIAGMSGEQRMVHNAIVKNHELAELGIKPKMHQTAFGHVTGHLGTQPPLRDNNMIATLPKGYDAVKETVKRYRPQEAYYLERATRGVGGKPGLEFGEQRLSRHARKRVGKLMEADALSGMKAQLEGPHGDAIKKGLKASGIPGMVGIGKF